MAKRTDPEVLLADAALKVLAKKAWRDVTLAEVAKAAKVPLRHVANVAPAKPALVGLILRRIGDKLTASYKADSGTQSGRDRLFDVSMAWFDVLGSHKPAVRSLYKGMRNDPLTLLSVRDAIVSAAEWLMTLAQADTGPALQLRALAFAAVLGRAIPVWLDDDRDLTKTMAQLDGDLRRGESWLGRG